MTRILGIESSCDETAAAVVDDRIHVRSSIVASQIDLHRSFGGVVPELAARRHVETIGEVIRQAMDEADADWDSVDAIAVTHGPGLVGSLLVGVAAAKAIAWQRELPLLAVNHLEGHVRSVFIEHPEIEFPTMALIVSGGHTSIYLCPEEGIYRLVARTRDDAAGEAFDKVAKLLGLGYPGGPLIDRIARGANENAIVFPRAQMKDGSLDFSFSGIKTAVRRQVQSEGLERAMGEGDQSDSRLRDLVASFQKAVVDALVDRVRKSCRRHGVRSVVVSGGVACNSRLREEFDRVARRGRLRVYFPSPRYTTDNAAMIAAAGFLHYDAGDLAPPDLSAISNLRL